MDIRERIIKGCDDLFLRYGLKSVTMDDIAAHVSVSKKTIYQHFSDKNELINLVAKTHMEQELKDIEEIVANSENAIDEMFKISSYIKTSTQNMNPTVVFDCKKYYPKAYELFQEHKQVCIHDVVVANLKAGKEQGFYRKDFDEEILARLRMQEIEISFDFNIFPIGEFSFQVIQEELFNHFIMGIISPEGLKLWKKYQEEN